MSAQKFFRIPFASAGDKTPIPDPAQGDGAISYSQGYGPPYELNPVTDPFAKRVPRNETNQLYFDLTENLRQYQLTGTPEWVTAAQNGSVSVAYDYGAKVRYDAGSGVKVWFSIVTNNTATPGADASKWVIDDPFDFMLNVASNTEVQAGTVNNKIVTPLNLTSRTATTTRTGLAALATGAEVIAGTSTTKVVTPDALAALTATETVAGLAAVATTAEVQAGTNSGKIVTPAGLVQRTATTTRTGIAALATQTEVNTGTDAAKLVTPATLSGRTATDTRTGVVELATSAETLAGSDASLAVTPAGLRALIYAGSTQDELNFPVGTILLVETGNDVQPVRNAVSTVYINTGLAQGYSTYASGALLNGTWRARGAIGATSSTNNDNGVLLQRVS